VIIAEENKTSTNTKWKGKLV